MSETTCSGSLNALISGQTCFLVVRIYFQKSGRVARYFHGAWEQNFGALGEQGSEEKTF